MHTGSDNKIVYSTEYGTMCPACGKPEKKCICRKNKSVPKSDGIIRVGRSTKGRKGKGVSVITGIPLEEHELKQLAKRLKQKCGTGGTVKDGVVEIQGDHRNLLVNELKKSGYSVKLSGG